MTPLIVSVSCHWGRRKGGSAGESARLTKNSEETPNGSKADQIGWTVSI